MSPASVWSLASQIELVLGAVGDQRGRGDVAGLASGRVLPDQPVGHGCALPGHGRGGARCGRVLGDRGLEGGVGAGLVGREIAAVGCGRGRRLLVRAVAGEGGAQHQPADLVRVQDGQGLGDGTAQGPAKHVRPAQPQGTDQRAGLVGHVVNAERHGQLPGPADAGVVEHHHPVVLGQGVHQPRVPLFDVPPVALDHDQRRPAADDPVPDGAVAGVGHPHRGRHHRGRTRRFLGRRGAARAQRGGQQRRDQD